ncbi:MAG: bifunctional nuclease family protein [Bacteroidia bacterium]|nr:bifunctional nuclease family protein [Bacteroidia bacterium]
MKKIKLEIAGLSYSQSQSGAYALVLVEEQGQRRLPIIIGGFEAQAIAIELEKMTPSRPLTHDLFKSFADAFEVSMQEIIIYNLVEGIFFSKIVCNKENKQIEIDARTSDAIALAVRFGANIYTYEFILASAGILLEGNTDTDSATTETQEEETVTNETDALSIEDLQQELNTAIANEDYEKASQLRDVITKRQSN